jgi:hypothetical protein
MGCVINATPRPLYPRERPGTHCIGGWVGPRDILDWCGTFRPYRDSISGPSTRGESLYRLSYPINSTREKVSWWNHGDFQLFFFFFTS